MWDNPLSWCAPRPTPGVPHAGSPYLIIGRVFDRFPHLNAAVGEVGHGWLPHWVKRLDAMIDYVASNTVSSLKYKAEEYVKMGRFCLSL